MAVAVSLRFPAVRQVSLNHDRVVLVVLRLCGQSDETTIHSRLLESPGEST